MKKIYSALFISLFGAAALMTSCSDVPVPYEVHAPGDVELVGEGTKENPYNIATSLIKQDGSTAWVQGYIVGVMETNVDPFSPSFTAPFNTNSNIMIADNQQEQSKKNCLIVQLPANALRTALNLKGHPENLGKPVILQGQLTSYFGAAGLKETNAGIFNGEEIGGEVSTDKDNPFGLDASNPVESFKADFQEQPDFTPEGDYNSNKNYNYELTGWKNVAYKGDRKWSGIVFKDNTKYIEASANKGKEELYEIWFVSPAFKVDAVADKKISFDCAGAYFNEANSLKVFFLELVDGKMTQEEIPVEGIPTSGTNYDWKRGLKADIAKYEGKVGFIGFQYISHNTNSTTYQLDNIQTGAGEGEVPAPEPGDDPFGLDASKTSTEFTADFEDFTDINKVYTKEGWVNKALAKGNPWQTATFKEDKYIKMNTYNTQSGDNIESWFITPAFVVGNKSKLSFDCAGANFTADMHLKVFFLQKDASGKVSQEEIIVKEIPTSGNNYEWVKDINVDLSKYNGKTGFVGFQYTAINNGATKGLPTYQIDNIKYTGDQGGEIDPPASSEGEYTSNVDFTGATDDGVYSEKATIEGTEYDVLKLGTSNKSGSWISPALTEGVTSLSFYGVSWKGKPASVTVTIEDGGSFEDGETSKDIACEPNEGATGTPTYTITPNAGDLKTLKLKGITSNSKLKFSTEKSKNKRVILFGINVK